MKLARLLALSAGHLVTDVNQGAIVILVPVVKASLGLSIGAATLLVTVSTVTSSLVQPVFGVLSDRFDLRWMIPGGVLVAGLGVAFAGLAPNYPLVLLAVLVSGLGVAAFHPESARWAGQAAAAGRKRATGMSYFSVGGNAGYALGVLVTAPLIVVAGSRAGAVWLLVPPIILAAVLLALVTRFRRAAGEVPAPVGTAVRAMLTRPMGLLVGIVALRSVLSVGTAALAPLYLHLVRGLSLPQAGTLTSLSLFAGAAGTLVGGPLADRLGRRTVILASMAISPPLALLFVLVPNWLGYTALVLMGAVIVSTFSVTVTMAQELMPAHQGTASGIMLGFAFGGGGIAVGLLGKLADVAGLTTTWHVLAGIPLVALVLAAGLPETREQSDELAAGEHRAGLAS
jgi:FSR family fosmidomycin resistance protein-like MFS transporter